MLCQRASSDLDRSICQCCEVRAKARQKCTPGILRDASSYSTSMLLATPRSCRICRISALTLFAISGLKPTRNSIPIPKSFPERSFGRTFVPRRFQSSGGTVPLTRRITSFFSSPCVGGSVTDGPGSGRGPSIGGTGGSGFPWPSLYAWAFSFVSRNTPASNATSSGPINFSNQTRS